jgi:SAM-dependent methyltransferase
MPSFSNIESDEDLLWSIDDSWSDDYFLGLRGWIVHKYKTLDRVTISVGDTNIAIDSWHDRPDVVAALPFNIDTKCGFWVQIPRKNEHRIRFEAQLGQDEIYSEATLLGSATAQSPMFPHSGGLFNEFVDYVNTNKLKVLEIGSRIVGDYSTNKRALFNDDVSYTGFDYYPDQNTDVVGDAHKLSSYFARESFDAVFSLSVFEHLAMPWVVAMEINKVLKPGGTTYHSTHFSWPLHEAPWDFWRFSDEGLKVLFSEPIGFKVNSCGFFHPLRMHLEDHLVGQEPLPIDKGFGGVAILATKTSSTDSKSFSWNASIEDVLSKDSHYPQRD